MCELGHSCKGFICTDVYLDAICTPAYMGLQNRPAPFVGSLSPSQSLCELIQSSILSCPCPRDFQVL